MKIGIFNDHGHLSLVYPIKEFFQVFTYGSNYSLVAIRYNSGTVYSWTSENKYEEYEQL